MKPLEKRIKNAAKTKKIPQDIIQQDYILSWLLVGIFNQPYLKSSLVFKGGTALKKGYFGDYRFSQDLDFSAYPHAPKGDFLLDCIEKACSDAQKRIAEYAPIKLEVERYVEKSPHPSEQEAFTVRAQFPWQREPLTVVMIEISRDEQILLPPVEIELIHDHEELIQQPILVYSLTEIVLEKLRSILQNTKKLHERDWARSRNRDYYDLWRIFQEFENSLVLTDFIPLLNKKCVLKQVHFTGVDSFFDSRMITKVVESWDTWLGKLVSQLPRHEVVLDDLRKKLEMLIGYHDEEISSLLQSMGMGSLKGKSLYEVLEKKILTHSLFNKSTSNGHYFLQLLINSRMDSYKKLQLVELSIEQGAELNCIDASGRTPYVTAIAKGEKLIADLLRSKGADPHVPLHMYWQYYQMYRRSPS